MKLKISAQKTIYRLTLDELHYLNLGNVLTEDFIFVDGNRLTYQLRVSLEDKFKFTFDRQKALINLEINQDTLSALKIPSKTGVVFYYQGSNSPFEVGVEVDLKSHLRSDVDA